MGKSTFAEEAILEHVLGIAEYTYAAGNRWVALYAGGSFLESNQHDDELTAEAGYGRLAVTFEKTGAGEYKNDADTAVLTAGGAGWLGGAPVTHFAVVDSATPGAGNILYHEALTTPKVVGANEPVQFKLGDLVIKEN